MYLDGELKYSIKMWLASDFGAIENINFAYGNRIYPGDNSMNEVIMCEVDNDNNLRLKMINISSNKKGFTAEDIAREIWKVSLSWIQ